MYVLTVIHGPDQGTKLEMSPGSSYHVGCNDDASFVLTDPMVLKNHCTIECTAESIVLRNNTASAGTYVGDKKVSQARVRPGVTFRIGDTHIKITAQLKATRRAAGGGSPGDVARPSQNDPLLGKIIGGYKLNKVLGVGGMGAVYLATQLSLQRDVAVKVLRSKLAKDKSYRDMFINEARAAAELIHANVVQVYDAGTEGDVSFFSMEYIGQGSVEEILARDGTIDWKVAILQVLEAAHGLSYAEGRGIVHRDIKPDNLMLNDDGRIKIADLGLAKKGEGGTDQGIIGTPHFIPPEQALGKRVDSRADIYSLGATFFRMITGKTVFTGKTAKEIVLKHIKEPAPAASSLNKEVPGDLDAVMARMLAKDPDARFAGTAELIHALEEVCAHHGIKGSIIKKGVGKRVLIPLVLLILAGSGAIIWLVNRAPKTVVNAADEARAKRLEDAQIKARAERARLERERKKDAVKNAHQGLKIADLQTDGTTPLDSTYDDEQEQVGREQLWRQVEQDYRDFATGDAAELAPDLARLATERADEIKERLKKLKEGAKHKKETIATYVANLTAKIEAQKKLLSEHRTKRHYNAALSLCSLIGAEKPGKNDPLGHPEAWEYRSSDVVTPATNIPAIIKPTAGARKHFRAERREVLTDAQSYWDSVKNKIDVEQLSTSGSDDEINKAIESLQEVVDSVPEPTTTPLAPELRPYVSGAKNMRKTLQTRLDNRRQRLIEEDRRSASTLMRQMVSLDAEVNPNRVMQCEFKDAASAWLRAKEEMKTDPYRRFAQERAEMLSWCYWLLQRFHRDMAAGGDAFSSLQVEFPLANNRIKRTKLTRADDNVQKFGLAHRDRDLGRKGIYNFSQFSMDWIHDSLFKYRTNLRWKPERATPAVRFALGAFCFETMMYDRAADHFKTLLDDATYGKLAKALAARATQESKAKQAWLKICQSVENAKSTDEIAAIRTTLGEYRAQFEGTLFYLEVMPSGATIAKDFFDPAATPLIVKAPTD